MKRKRHTIYLKVQDYFNNHDDIVHQRWADLKGFGINGKKLIYKSENVRVNGKWQRGYF